VHRGELVEELRVHELQARLEQLRANDQRHQAADDEHREAEAQVKRADILVIRRGQPSPNARGLAQARGVAGECEGVCTLFS